MTLKLDIRKSIVNTKTVFAVAVSNNKAMTLGELALAVCSPVSDVFRDILLLDDNSHVVDQLWDDYGKSKIKILRDRANKELQGIYQDILDGITTFGDEETVEEIHTRGLGAAVEYMKFKKDVSWKEWKVDLPKLGELLLTPELKQSNWARCRADHSNAMLDETAVKRYIAEIENLKPHLLKAEKLVAEFDAKCKAWNEGYGKDVLTTIAALSAASAVTTVYAAQHPQADGISQISNELLHHFSAKGDEDITVVLRQPLDKAKALYRDPGFNKALYSYLQNWSWSEHYYFHAVAAKSADLANFDDRLFAAMNRIGEYLAIDPDMGTSLANEANAIAGKIWKDVSRVGVKQTVPTEEQEEQAEEQTVPSPKAAQKALDDLFTYVDSGWLSTLSVWNGYAWTMAGNFDGPPSVLSLMLSRFCANDQFIAQLKNDTLIKKVAMIGFSPKERAAVLILARRDKNDLAARLFKETSWRSKSVFAVQGVLSVALLLFSDIPRFYDAYKANGDRAHYNKELTKSIVALSQSMLNLGLVATSWITSKEMDFFLAKNSITVKNISSHLAASSNNTVRVLAVRAMHGTMAFGAVIMSAIDLKDGWGKAGPIQRALLVGATVAPIATLAAIAGSFGMLGPIAFLGGVAIGLMIAAVRWFQPEIEGTLQKLVSVVEDSRSYSLHEGDTVPLRYLQFKNKSKMSVEDLLELLEDEISDLDWSSKLDKKYAIDYLLAGVPKSILAAMYDTSVTAQKPLLRRQSKNLNQQRLSRTSRGVHLMWPSSTKVPVVVGANTLIRVILSGYSSGEIGDVWLEWDDSLIDRHLDTSLTGYHDDRGVVFLTRRIRTSSVLFYECRIRVLTPPPISANKPLELPLRLHASEGFRIAPQMDDPTNEAQWEARQKSIVETLTLNFPVKL